MHSVKFIKLDFYTLRAAEMFHVAYGKVTPFQRYEAKQRLYAFEFGADNNDPYNHDLIFDPTIKLLN